jgi:ubiquinone/menaquinone biosynthesis C-methylase UbiE
MSSIESHYSVKDIEARILAGLRAAGLDPAQRLEPEQLAALDHFHTGGLQASRELLAMARIASGDRVLDVGAGLAGSARFLAVESGCSVDCIEMSGDYCVGAELLNRITGFEDRISVKQGSALDLPYPDDRFDVVWMQNVGMNIEDKPGLYREIARALKPGGRFAFQEVAAGDGVVSCFPLPWASEAGQNFLISGERMQSLLADLGLVAEAFEDVSDSQFSTSKANSTPADQGQLGLGVYVDNLAEKAGNAKRCLEAGQIRYVRGVFRENRKAGVSR